MKKIFRLLLILAGVCLAPNTFAQGNNAAVCCLIEAGQTDVYYASLQEAFDYANLHPNTPVTIVLTQDYTLPAGGYILPKKATLLVPCTDTRSDAFFGPCAHPDRQTNSYNTPTQFRQLTLAAGAYIDVQGVVETGARQSTQFAMMGAVSGPYGRIHMEPGSSMTLENQAMLRAWGYVTGEGTIDVKRGAVVREFFQVTDWKGGANTASLIGNVMRYNYKSKRVFPINQYFIQNVEAATTYHPGARLVASSGIYANSINAMTDSIIVIGCKGNSTDAALLLLNEEDQSANTWIRKSYLPATDQQYYEVNSDASIGSMSIEVNTYRMNSGDYVLPVTNNIWIKLLTGYMDITQPTELLPGAIIENMKETNIAINEDAALYIYDAEDWKNCYGEHYTMPVHYSPTKTITRPDEQGNDAEIFVHGTWQVEGALYTSEHGANIHSTNADAGKVIFFNGAAPDTTLNEYLRTTATSSNPLQGNEIAFSRNTFTNALLTNATAPHTATTDAAIDDAFCYIDGRWAKLVNMGCWTIDQTEAFPAWTYYANPGDFVAVAADVTEEGALPEPDEQTHLFYAADSTRTFVLLNDCQWWEVTPKNGLYYAAKNGKYYEYDADNYEWRMATRNVTWMNGTSNIGDYQVAFLTEPTYYGDTPSKTGATGVYYAFLGWNTDPAATAALSELDPVMEDVTYYAIFSEEHVKQTVTWRNYDNTLLATELVNQGALPTMPYIPERASVDTCAYVFTGWKSNVTTYTYLHEVPVVSNQDVTYTATFRQIRRHFDIVEWDTARLVLNLTNFSTDNLTYQIDDQPEAAIVGAQYGTAYMPVHNLTPDDTIRIRLYRNSQLLYDERYIVPIVIMNDNVLADVTKTVRVNKGSLIVDQNVQADEVYVNPGASVRVVDGALRCKTLVLRTSPQEAASIMGNIQADHVFYTRITGYKPLSSQTDDEEYAFALPLPVRMDSVRLSDNSRSAYGTSWNLRYFDERTGAKQSLEEAWKQFDGNIIQPTVGYLLSTNATEYREYYFPVDLNQLLAATPVAYYHGVADERYTGWNYVCSPRVSSEMLSQAQPMVRAFLTEDHETWLQTLDANLQPAQPFLYQTSGDVSSILAAGALPAQADERYILTVSDGESTPDEMGVFTAASFSNRFDEHYDVTKLSTTSATRPLIYTRVGEQDWAFAAIAPAALNGGVDVIVDAPMAGELTFTKNQGVCFCTPDRRVVAESGVETFTCEVETGINHFLLTDDPTLTSLEQISSGSSANSATFKTLINGQIYIIRSNGSSNDSNGCGIYTITGLRVK